MQSAILAALVAAAVVLYLYALVPQFGWHALLPLAIAAGAALLQRSTKRRAANVQTFDGIKQAFDRRWQASRDQLEQMREDATRMLEANNISAEAQLLEGQQQERARLQALLEAELEAATEREHATLLAQIGERRDQLEAAIEERRQALQLDLVQFAQQNDSMESGEARRALARYMEEKIEAL